MKDLGEVVDNGLEELARSVVLLSESRDRDALRIALLAIKADVEWLLKCLGEGRAKEAS